MAEFLPRKRIRHFDGEGHARELTFSCFQRRALFAKPYVFEWFFKALAKARKEHPIHVWAYVVMPEHVHLLVWPTEPEFKISKLLETVKSSVSKRARNHLLRTNPAVIEATDGEFHFWQPGPGYDRNLDNEATIWAAIDYFHMNPVHRGLCVRPEDWPWSSAGIYAGLRDDPFPIDRESLPPDPRR
ncbi:MAG: transposase [Planctomycetales bacterium]|nr:transposase [Planctomycetales bacterium]